MCTVAALIERLQQYPPDWQVFDIDGMSVCEPLESLSPVEASC